MASAGPVALLILISVLSGFLLPIMCWILAYWQHKKKLHSLFRKTLALSLLPIISFVMLFYGKDYISAKYNLLYFFSTPFISFIIFLILFGFTIKSSRKHDL